MAFGKWILSVLLLMSLLLGGCQTERSSQSSQQAEAEAEPAVSADIAIVGEVIDDQSFSVALEPAGELEFLSSKETSESGRPVYHFYLKDENAVLTELKYDWLDEGYAELKAVAFRDVNRDGKKDILAIIDQTTGIGRMGTIPYSSVLVFVQGDASFEYEASIAAAIEEANAYRQITVDQAMEIVQSGFESNADKAWESLTPGAYELEGSSEWGGSVITIAEAHADKLRFELDAFSVRGGEEGLEEGNVNIGNIPESEAFRSYEDMLFQDDDVEFELSLSLISPDVLHVWDNGDAYFGYGVIAEGVYTLKKQL